jgi:hypothetical protein
LAFSERRETDKGTKGIKGKEEDGRELNIRNHFPFEFNGQFPLVSKQTLFI